MEPKENLEKATLLRRIRLPGQMSHFKTQQASWGASPQSESE